MTTPEQNPVRYFVKQNGFGCPIAYFKFIDSKGWVVDASGVESPSVLYSLAIALELVASGKWVEITESEAREMVENEARKAADEIINGPIEAVKRESIELAIKSALDRHSRQLRERVKELEAERDALQAKVKEHEAFLSRIESTLGLKYKTP